MRLIFFVSFFLVSLIQYGTSKELSKNDLIPNAAGNNQRSITDIWNNIKNSAKNAWDAIKNIANKTKEKIRVWVENVKIRANKLAKELEIKMQNLQEKSKVLLQEILGTGQLVKQCMEEDNEQIEKILKQILNQVTSCISENIFKLSKLDEQQLVELKDKDFLKRVEEKLNKCTQDNDNPEECFTRVRKEIFKETEIKESEILKNRTESRNLADDVLETIIACTVDGLINASNAIANEAIEIIDCVIQG